MSPSTKALQMPHSMSLTFLLPLLCKIDVLKLSKQGQLLQHGMEGGGSAFTRHGESRDAS